MNKSAYIICVLLILWSCTSKSPKNSFSDNTAQVTSTQEECLIEKRAFVLDITKTIETKDVIIQNIADISYVPLETRNDVLIEAVFSYMVSEDNILAYNKREGSIFIFGIEGKLKHKFKRKGGSGEEYMICHRATIDEKRNEVFVLDDMRRQQILVYSFDGVYKRTLKIPFKSFNTLYNWDDDYLFLHDISSYMHFQRKGEEHFYFLLSKTNGEIVTLPMKSTDASIPTVEVKQKDGTSNFYNMGIFPVLKNGKETIIADFGCDTVYNCSNNQIEPLVIKSPCPHLMEPSVLIAPYLKTDRYLYLQVKEKRQDSKSFILCCDLKGLTNNKIEFLNSDYITKSSANFFNILMEVGIKNCAIDLLPAEYLVECYKNEQLKGDLKEVASKLSEDDNPVLMITKFKE